MSAPAMPTFPRSRVALAGQTATVLRRRGDYAPRYWLEFLSRASDIRVHHVRPVDRRRPGGRRDHAVALAARPVPRHLPGPRQDRARRRPDLLDPAGARRPALARHRPADRGARARRPRMSRAAPSPSPSRRSPPRSRSSALYANFASMAARIERRSRYLRDFAAAVSHEFKTPIAGITRRARAARGP